MSNLCFAVPFCGVYRACPFPTPPRPNPTHKRLVILAAKDYYSSGHRHTSLCPKQHVIMTDDR